MRVSGRLAALVEERAGGRCEYCQLAQAGQEARFHIDHVVPRALAGETTLKNLALACVSCSLRKGARLYLTDAGTGARVRIFHPREESWEAHFRWDGVSIVGLTATGRATVDALQLNRSLVVAIRQGEAVRPRRPPTNL